MSIHSFHVFALDVETIEMEPIGRGVLDAPHARGMTN